MRAVPSTDARHGALRAARLPGLSRSLAATLRLAPPHGRLTAGLPRLADNSSMRLISASIPGAKARPSCSVPWPRSRRSFGLSNGASLVAHAVSTSPFILPVTALMRSSAKPVSCAAG